MMMTMKKMRMRMRGERLREDDEELLLGRLKAPSSPDLQKSSPSTLMTTTIGPPTMLPTMAWPRRSLIRQIADAVAGLSRSATAAVAGTPENVPTNDVDRNNSASHNAAEDEDDYDVAKCVVGSIRTYCWNCRRYHHAHVSL